MRVTVIGHDAGDAALAKRIGQMRAEGHAVRALTLRRGPDAARDWDNTDLGQTRDGDFAQRLGAIARAVPKAARALGPADVLWARNLDAALIARGALALARSRVPLIYECLDVHDLASGEGAASGMVRALERLVLDRAALTVVSSEAFVREHFTPRYGEQPFAVIENRLAVDGLVPRPDGSRPDRPLTIGWFGILRCARSLDLLLGAAERAEGAVRLVMAGRPATDQLPGFEARIAACPFAEYLGPYAAPGDLAALHARVDLVWAGDWFQAGANSRWLLPNRLYEAGWFGVPALAPEGTETAAWALRHGTGLAVPDPSERALPGLLAAMTSERLAAMRDAVLAAPGALFAGGADEVTAALERAAC